MKYLIFPCFLFFLLIWPSLSMAGSLFFIQDAMNHQQAAGYSNHTFRFTTSSGVHDTNDTIQIHFHEEFNCNEISFEDISLFHGISEATIQELIGREAGINKWGAIFVNNVLTLTPPIDTQNNEIASNEIIMVRVGNHVQGGRHQCKNPATPGSYIIGINGGFDDSGFLAVAITSTQVGVEALNKKKSQLFIDAIKPSVRIMSPKINEEYHTQETVLIKWTAVDNEVLKQYPINLYYVFDNTQIIIEEGLINTGEYAWTLPDREGLYHIRVEARDMSGNIGFALSDGAFIVQKELVEEEILVEDLQEEEILLEEEIVDPELILEPEKEIFQEKLFPCAKDFFDSAIINTLIEFKEDIEHGDIVKAPSISTVYMYAKDNKRYIFPSRSIYETWFRNFDELKPIKETCLQQIPLGKNIHVRAGTDLVKMQSNPRVYAVEPHGVLRWIASEETALKLYGKYWNAKIMELDPVFFADYTIGEDLMGEFHPEGTLIKYRSDPDVFYIQDGKKRKFVNEQAFYDNYFHWEHILEIADDFVYEDGEDIVEGKVNLIHLYGV